MSLPPALAPLVALRQWVTYRLVPVDGKPNKTDKLPCHWQTGHVCDAQSPSNWTTYDQALGGAALADVGRGAGVGFVISPGDPFWFLDIDNCLQTGVDGQPCWSPLALDLIARLPGAAVEISQSGRGLHIIGSGIVPPHRCKNIPLGLELYTERRFIAITGRSAQGDARADLTAAMAAVVAEHFQPRADSGHGPLTDWTSEPCEGWNGPLDDAELIRRARKSKPRLSPALALRPGSGASVTFEALWTADAGVLAEAWPGNSPEKPYDASSADMSLATKLAFWTGRDCERIERLMRMSGLMRDKYERRDYIEGTVMLAAGGVSKVLEDKAPPQPVDVVLTGRPEPRALTLSNGELDDKQSHLAIEYWLTTVGKHQIVYDEFADRILFDGEPLTDHIERAAWLDLREASTLKFPKELFGDVVRRVAWANRFHPLRDWLRDTEPTWDGTPRIDSWLTTYLGVPMTPLSSAIGAIFLTAAVRRARQPGCKFDELLVLEGPQGIEKSSAVAALCPERSWFSEDFNVSMSSKELLEATHGKWLVEAPELSKLNASQVEHVKHLLSRQWDKARMAYDRMSTERGRQWVGFGTVNPDRYLSDPTGNRRFWPVKCGAIDVAAIERDRGQLWAEAAQRETSGASIRLPKHLWEAAAAEQEARVVVDPFMSRLEPALEPFAFGRIQTQALWDYLGIPFDRQPALGKKLSDTLQRMGWVHSRQRIEGIRQYVFVKGSEADPKPDIFFDVSSRKFSVERPKLSLVTPATPEAPSA